MQEDLKSKHDRVRDDWKGGLITHAGACTILGYEIDPDGDRYYPGTTGDGTGLPGDELGTDEADDQADGENENENEDEDDDGGA
jgi:hypothetical protein